MSGYADYSGESVAPSRARTGFLEKPFAPNALARKVRDLLDTAGTTAPGAAASDALQWETAYGQSQTTAPST